VTKSQISLFITKSPGPGHVFVYPGTQRRVFETKNVEKVARCTEFESKKLPRSITIATFRVIMKILGLLSFDFLRLYQAS
jgi:hypothetical protein